MSLATVPWEHLASYRAVLKTGSLSAAARSLGLSQPTVRGHIEALEKRIGAALFLRVATGLEPLPGHEALESLVDAMDASATAFARRAFADSNAVAGPVRITCPDIFGVEILQPALRELGRTWRDLELELHLSNAIENILQREADIAVRLTKPTQNAILTKRVKSIEFGFFASPMSEAAKLATSSFEEVASSGLLILQDRNRTIEAALEARGFTVPACAILRTDDDLAQLSAIRSGLGIGITQTRIAEQSGLVRVCPDLGLRSEVWVAMHEDLKGHRRMRVVFDALVSSLG